METEAIQLTDVLTATNAADVWSCSIPVAIPIHDWRVTIGDGHYGVAQYVDSHATLFVGRSEVTLSVFAFILGGVLTAAALLVVFGSVWRGGKREQTNAA